MTAGAMADDAAPSHPLVRCATAAAGCCRVAAALAAVGVGGLSWLQRAGRVSRGRHAAAACCWPLLAALLSWHSIEHALKWQQDADISLALHLHAQQATCECGHGNGGMGAHHKAFTAREPPVQHSSFTGGHMSADVSLSGCHHLCVFVLQGLQRAVIVELFACVQLMGRLPFPLCCQ